MEILLLGTGAADGWPNPFCTCSSCSSALASGDVRGQTSALVDGRLLLDCGPEAPRAALRSGASLAGVRHLLVTHSHPDHAGPAALLFRSWAGRTEPLDLVGPPETLEVFRDWVGPDDPVRWVPVAAGDRIDLDGYEVRVLAATHGDSMTGPGVLYDVAGPDGTRVLWATDTGPLGAETYEAVEGREYDVVLLEETFGDRLDHGTDHLDLSTFPAVLAGLRSRGAVVAGTDVVAVHLGHQNPPTDRLLTRLAPWGARAVPDGTRLRTTADAATPGPDPGRQAGRTLVLGGARSGKSAWAEALLAADPDVTYVATSGHRADDTEWQRRVEAHRARRPAGWRTVETTDLVPLLRGAEPGERLLIDCVTLWLSTVAEEAGVWAGDDASAFDKVSACCDELAAAWRATRGLVVAVSNEVGSGVVPATASGRWFRDELGRLNARLATESDCVLLLVAGQPLVLKQPASPTHERREPRAEGAR